MFLCVRKIEREKERIYINVECILKYYKRNMLMGKNVYNCIDRLVLVIIINNFMNYLKFDLYLLFNDFFIVYMLFL